MQRKHIRALHWSVLYESRGREKDKSITETVQNSVVYHKGAGEKLPRGPYNDYNY